MHQTCCAAGGVCFINLLYDASLCFDKSACQRGEGHTVYTITFTQFTTRTVKLSILAVESAASGRR